MNNLKYYNDSLAYDFDMFMPKTAPEERRDNIVVMPQKAEKQNKRIVADCSYAKNRIEKRNLNK
jgi:hypothetical protein